MSKEKFAFDKTNFILLGIGMAVVIIGFLLMTGPVSTPTTFEPDIFSGTHQGGSGSLPAGVCVHDICRAAQA